LPICISPDKENQRPDGGHQAGRQQHQDKSAGFFRDAGDCFANQAKGQPQASQAACAEQGDAEIRQPAEPEMFGLEVSYREHRQAEDDAGGGERRQRQGKALPAQ